MVGCATQPGAVELTGLEQFQAPCPDEPAQLSDQEAQAYAAAVDAAMALPTAEGRVAALKTNVLEPLIQRDQRLRRCGLYERTRADSILAAAAQFNQIVRDRD